MVEGGALILPPADEGRRAGFFTSLKGNVLSLYNRDLSIEMGN